jgi:hypothetical protein
VPRPTYRNTSGVSPPHLLTRVAEQSGDRARNDARSTPLLTVLSTVRFIPGSWRAALAVFNTALTAVAAGGEGRWRIQGGMGSVRNANDAVPMERARCAPHPFEHCRAEFGGSQ